MNFMPNGMEKDKISIEVIYGFPSSAKLKALTSIYRTIFDDSDVPFFIDRLKTQPKALSVLAYIDNELIGFKIGYPYNETKFYSWIGGVLPEYRNKGIATLLLANQEIQVKKLGYNSLRTKSMNKFKPMMIFNLKNDFNIVKLYTNTNGQTKIVFEK